MGLRDGLAANRTQVIFPAPTWWLTTVCKASSWGFNTFFWPLVTALMWYTDKKIHRCKIKCKSILKNKLYHSK